VLHYTRWQKKRASDVLGINASTLYRKLIAYGVEKPGGDREDDGMEDTRDDTPEAHAA
jgi:DNA-binding NtrC family response regulator